MIFLIIQLHVNVNVKTSYVYTRKHDTELLHYLLEEALCFITHPKVCKIEGNLKDGLIWSVSAIDITYPLSTLFQRPRSELSYPWSLKLYAWRRVCMRHT